VEQHLEGKDAEIKESVIAVEVFGRGGSRSQTELDRAEGGRQATCAAE
jgi:hypothetical protein